MIPALFHLSLPCLIDIIQLTLLRCCSNCGGDGFALHYGRSTGARSEKDGCTHTTGTGVVIFSNMTL